MRKDKAYLKVGRSVITQTKDSNDVVTSRDINESNYLANSREEFYLMYSSMVLILKSSTDVKMKLFAALLERYAQGQEFSMNKSLKALIAEETKCSARSLDSSFTFLVKHNYVVKLNSQLYRINPRHVFQGSSSERNKQLVAVLKLHCPTC